MMEYKLAELFDLQMGKTPSRNNPLYWNSNDNAWVSIADLSETDGKYVTRTKEFLTDKAVVESGIKKIPANTVIMSFKLSIGKVAITPVAMYSNEAIMAFIDKGIEKIVPDYLYYLFLHKNWNKGTNKAVMGITLNKKILSDTSIYLHSIEEQKAIIEILDKVTDLIAKRKSQLLALDDLIKARFVEMFGDPIKNPKEWPVFLIEDVVAKEKNALKAGPFGSDLRKEYYVNSGYKIYGQEQVIRENPFFGDYYISEEKFKQLENCSVQAGDVLISLVGTYGKLLIIPEQFEPGIINPRLMKITFDKTKVNPYYFKYFFQSEALKRALADNTHGGTMDILNLGIVRKLRLPLPPLKFQNDFNVFIKQIDKSKVVYLKAARKYHKQSKVVEMKMSQC